MIVPILLSWMDHPNKTLNFSNYMNFGILPNGSADDTSFTTHTYIR